MKKAAYLALALLPVGRALAEEEQSVFHVGTTPLLVVAVIALIIALTVVNAMKAQMKTARYKNEATDYVRDGSFKLDVEQDYFLYRTVDRTRIEKSDDK